MFANVATIRNSFARRLPAILLFLLFAGLVAFQTLVYFEYNLKWIDTDQFFMWTGVYDFAAGHFYEPRYYGQNYNTFLEALVAVPFYKMGLPVYQALPLATNLLFLFPIFTSVVILYRAGKIWHALTFLCIILCMNSAYFLLNSLPRGFVTGLFFCSFFLKSFLNPNHKGWLVSNTAAGVLAYFVNPNSLVLTVPLLTYLFFMNFRHRWYYWWTGAAALLFLPFDYFFNHFYRLHPDYIKTELIMDFGLRYLSENLTDLSRAFAQITPFTEQKVIWLVSLTGLITAGLILQKRKQLVLAFCSLLIFLLVSMTLGKTRDGGVWVYLPFSRMYLGIPLVLAFFVSTLDLNKKLLLILIPLSVLNLSVNLQKHVEQFKWHYEPQNWNALSLISLESALDTRAFYGAKCKEQKADFLLVSHRFWAVNPICYGGKPLDENYPETMETKWDKRYMVRNKYENKVIPRFILISTTYDIADKLGQHSAFEITKLDDYGLALITNNTLPLNQFIELEKQQEIPY